MVRKVANKRNREMTALERRNHLRFQHLGSAIRAGKVLDALMREYCYPSTASLINIATNRLVESIKEKYEIDRRALRMIALQEREDANH